MKLKCRPEDFRVEELPSTSPAAVGRYALYRLTKRSIGTIEAVEAICRQWNLAGRRVSYGGLKDRHAVTIQYLTIADGPARLLNAANFTLEPVGRLSQPYGPQNFRGNNFQLVLRDMAEADVRRASTEIQSLARDGLPNYFDDQRFGSVGYSGQFIAHAWLVGDHERALKLALAEANPFDRSTAKAQKVVLREWWGRWTEAKARLERSSARSIVTYLVDHPTDFRGAFARLRREFRTLYFSAFQSHLWNLILARWIERLTSPDQRVILELKGGAFPFPSRLTPEQVEALRNSPIPLPSSRTPEPVETLGEVTKEVLDGFQLVWPQLRVKHLKDVFFSKGFRPALAFAENLEFSTRDDDMHPARRIIHLGFELAKGSYATILVKRITDAADKSR
jgi:tRNA pseudouridine13 synthase